MLRIQINICDLVFYSVSEPLEMEFSLDNPGFEMDVSDQVDIHQADVARTSSGSSSSGESTRRSCTRCHGRMSSFSLDRHIFCIKCRGSDCGQDTRCDECCHGPRRRWMDILTLSRPLDINYVLDQGQGHGHLSKYLISGLIFHFFHVYLKKKLQTLL